MSTRNGNGTAEKSPAIRKRLGMRADKRPHIFTYRRCSHADSARTGLGLQEQDRILDAFIEFLLARLNLTRDDVVIAERLTDEVVSAYKVQLGKRPAGKKLLGLIEPGDHIIFPKVDRAFRDFGDLYMQMKAWEDMNVSVYFANENIDLSTPTGRLLLNMIGIFAEWESVLTSERNCATARRLKEEGRPVNQKIPPGFEIVGEPGKRHLKDARKKQAWIGVWIVEMRDEKGWDWGLIADKVEHRLANPLPATKKRKKK